MRPGLFFFRSKKIMSGYQSLLPAGMLLAERATDCPIVQAESITLFQPRRNAVQRFGQRCAPSLYVGIAAAFLNTGRQRFQTVG